jgi:hypothetical protein
MTKIKSKGGRPTLYKPEYCEMLIEHMAEGFTFESFAGVVRVARDTLFEWRRNHPEFFYAQRVGYGLLQLHDERILKHGMTGRNKDINSTLMIFKMKNCHGWRDKIEFEDVTKIDIEQLKAEAKKLLDEE